MMHSRKDSNGSKARARKRREGDDVEWEGESGQEIPKLVSSSQVAGSISMAAGRVPKRRRSSAPSYLKRPTPSFIRFKNDYAEELKSKGVHKPLRDITGEASELWKKRSAEEKEPYEAAYFKEMEIYKTQKRLPSKKFLGPSSSALSRFIEVVSQFGEKKRKAVQEIGFGNLLELKCSHLNRDLCQHLIAGFDCTSRRLRVGDEKSIPISTLDIESILGIPCTRLPVPSGIPSRALWIEDGGFSQKKGLNITTLAGKLLKLDAGDEFKRAFVLFTCRAILSPNGRNEDYLKLLKAVDRVKNIRTYNWCSYVLDYLLKSIKTSSGSKMRCNIIFLQFDYLMRVDVKWPSPKGDVQSIGFWTDKLIKARIRFEKEEIGGFGRCQEMKRLCWFLNDDLTAAVLSKLPAKTLLGIKCVWREWCRLISDRSFIQFQLKRMEPIAGLFFQEWSRWSNYDIASVSYIAPVSYIPVTTGSKVNQTVLNFLPESVVVLGVSNGLLCCRSCFSSKRPSSKRPSPKRPVIYVCNPSNKEWVSLQWPAPDKRNILALVFDPFRDPVVVSTNFEVVRVHKIVTEVEDTDYSTVIEMEDLYFLFDIYSSESGTWRRSMEICKCNQNLLKNKGICVGKVLYWPTDGDKVLMFDLEKELSWLLTVPVPQQCRHHTMPEICIGESERQLHYVLISEDGLRVWVLEDYLESKWEIKHFIALDKMEEENPKLLCDALQVFDIPRMDPLAYKDGLLFMRVSMWIFSYHFETREMEELCSLDMLGPYSLNFPILLPYSPSLVPLHRH